MPFLPKADTNERFAKLQAEIKKGNYILTKEDAILNNKLAGRYENNVLVEPYVSINAEIAAEAAAEGLKNTIWQQVAGLNVNQVINTLLTGQGSGNGSPLDTSTTPGNTGNSPVGFPPEQNEGIDWGKYLPYIIGAIVVGLLLYFFRKKIFGA